MACSVKSPLAQLPRTPVSVNGVIIRHDTISREVQHHPATTPVAGWQQAARALVVREILLQEAKRLGINASPIVDGDKRRETDDEAMIRTLVEREITTPEPDRATCERYYRHNLARFRAADLYEVSHILLSVRQDDAGAYAETCQRAAAILSALEKAPESFAELAKSHSTCPSAALGGNLGQISPGETTPEFEAALSLLSEGETTAAPVQTRYGLHIIKLHRKITGDVLPFEMVQARIADYLSEKSRRAATAQYLARLAARADIAGVQFPTPAELRVY